MTKKAIIFLAFARFDSQCAYMYVPCRCVCVCLLYTCESTKYTTITKLIKLDTAKHNETTESRQNPKLFILNGGENNINWLTIIICALRQSDRRIECKKKIVTPPRSIRISVLFFFSFVIFAARTSFSLCLVINGKKLTDRH